MPIKFGDRVKVEYVGTLDDGTVFDSSEKYGSPIEFVVGAGQVISGFEKAVLGMEMGEEKEFTLEPEEAYGEYDPNLVEKVPRNMLPEDINEGTLLVITLPNGVQLPAKVSKITENTATLDFNHPLAGERLHFKIKVVDIKSET